MISAIQVNYLTLNLGTKLIAFVLMTVNGFLFIFYLWWKGITPNQKALASKICLLKPWPNVLASRRKFKSWVYFGLLATPFALTCDDLRSLWSRSNLHANQGKFSPFGLPTQVKASWVTSINLLLANEIQDISALKWVFATRVYLWGNLQCVWPPNASLYESSTRPQLRLLAGPFDQYFRIKL